MSSTKKTKVLTLANLKVGVVCALLAQPFEVIRTSSIINQHKINNLNFKGMLSIIKLIKDSEGIKGFFRGGMLSIFKTTFGYAFFFTGLESMNSFSSKTPIFQHLPNKIIDFSNAMLSKTMTTFIISPVNVLKTRFEVIGNNEYRSIREGVEKIYQNEGMRGFYRGILATMIRDGPFSGIQYALYRSILDISSYYKTFRQGLLMKYNDNSLIEKEGSFNKDLIDNINEIKEKNQGGASKSLIAFAAATSSAMAIMITYPFDNIRVRYQIEKGKTKTLNELFKEVYVNEGMVGFYKGYLPRLLKKICSGALTWSLYEHIKKGNNLNI